MTIIHSYTSQSEQERQARQAAIYRRCLLLLQATRARS